MTRVCRVSGELTSGRYPLVQRARTLTEAATGPIHCTMALLVPTEATTGPTPYTVTSLVATEATAGHIHYTVAH